MARIRTIKPGAWQDPRIGRLSVPARLLWVVLITLADDDGRLLALPHVICAHGYAFDSDALAALPGLLAELENAGLLVLYDVDGVRYGWHPKWAVHQVINRKTDSSLPAPPDGSLNGRNAGAVSPHGTVSEDSQPEGIGKEEDRKGREDDSARGAVVDVVPPPPVVSEETDRVCDTLGQAGLNVYDRSAMQSLLAEHPEVDGVEAAIRCANWARGKRAKHPLKALAPFLTAEDAPKRQIPQGGLSKYDEGTIQGELS